MAQYPGTAGHSFTSTTILAVIILDARADENWLVQSCLSQRPFAWQHFVDRFLPVVLKTIQEVDVQSSRGWQESVQHEMSQAVFKRLKQDDCQLLRDWDTSTDFETWLIVVTRRVVLSGQESS